MLQHTPDYCTDRASRVKVRDEMRPEEDVAKLLKKFSTSELMREVRRRQVKNINPEKRSQIAKDAALVRWAKKKGKEILGGM